MEFFRLKRLKATLLRGPLPPSDTAKYLAASAALCSVALIPSPGDVLSHWTLLAYPALALLGVYYCYRRNGGAVGDRFAERYIAIGWVVGLRVTVVVFLLTALGLVAFTVVRGFDGSWLEHPAATHVVDVGTLGVVAVVYWRMGVQLADVHRATRLADRLPPSNP